MSRKLMFETYDFVHYCLNRLNILALLCLLPRLSCRTAVRPDNGESSLQKSNVEYVPTPGSCEDYHEQAQTPAWAGDTVASLRAVLNSEEDKPKGVPKGFVNRWSCSCNKKEYDNEDKCVEECKVSMGCFTGICQPIGQTDQACMTKSAIIQFVVTNKTTINKWSPSASDSKVAACMAAAETYTASVAAHESVHAKENTEIVDQWNQSHKNTMSFTSCAKTADAATELNRQKFVDEATKQHSELKNQMSEAAEKFHASPAGSHANINCSACPD
jgi:hypothetical protein